MTTKYQAPKIAPAMPAHLVAVPSPVTLAVALGQGWKPPAVLREEYANTPNQYGHLDPAAEEPPRDLIVAAELAWNCYRAALKDADRKRWEADPEVIAHHRALGRIPCFAGYVEGPAFDALLTVYHRARLAAYVLALGPHGQDLYRIERANMAFRAALQIKTGGAITEDLCPDLPRRLDLTDEAVDCVDEFGRGLITWRRMQYRLKRPAAAAVREALDDMGWHYGMKD